MFELLIFFLILTGIILFAGVFISRILIFEHSNQLSLHEYGFIGIFVFTYLSIFIHFFFPLNLITNSIVVLIFTFSGLFIYTKSQLKIFDDKLILILSIIVVYLMTIYYKPNEDYGFYHLPYTINLISEKIIFGLSNLQIQYAWNSSWLNFSSIFYLPLMEIKGTQLLNSVLYFFIIIFFFKEIYSYKNRNKISYYYILFLSFYIFTKFARIKEHGIDLPANFFLLISFYYFLKLNESNDSVNISKYSVFVILFSTLCISIKLSTFLAPLLFLSTLIITYKKFKKIINLKIILLSLSFLSIWFLQQFIYSGCLVPFFSFTCLNFVEWYHLGLTDSVSGAIGSINKSYNDYEGTLSRLEYVKNFNWVPTWFNRHKIELIEHLISFIIPVILIFSINLNNKNIKKNDMFLLKQNKNIIIYFLLFIFLGNGIWFIKSPVIRLGIPYLYTLAFFFIFILIYIFNQGKINFSKGIKVLLLISLGFNASKNINRIIQNNNFQNVWPSILNVEYSFTNKNGFIINFPDSKEKNHLKKLCWSIPFICHIGKSDGIKIYKKNNYLFITKN